MRSVGYRFTLPIALRCTAAALWCAFISAPQADEANTFTILWAKNPSPPFHVVDGPFRDKGICDVLVDGLTEALPQLHHDVVVMPQSRINNNVEQQDNLCFPCMIKRESNPYFYYTDQTVEHPPLGIIVSFPTYLHLGSPSSISFAELAADTTLRFGRPAARRYPDALQEIVDKYENSDRFFELNGDDATVRVMEQITIKRLDYTLEYPTILRYYRLIHASDRLVFIPTTEIGMEPIPGAIGCTKNEWGKQAIKYINEGLKAVMADPDYQAQQAFWKTQE